MSGLAGFDAETSGQVRQGDGLQPFDQNLFRMVHGRGDRGVDGALDGAIRGIVVEADGEEAFGADRSQDVEKGDLFQIAVQSPAAAMPSTTPPTTGPPTSPRPTSMSTSAMPAWAASG